MQDKAKFVLLLAAGMLIIVPCIVLQLLLLSDKLKLLFLGRIVCQVGEMEVPKQGQIEVNINGKLGKSPSDVQFTYQVSANFCIDLFYTLCIA